MSVEIKRLTTDDLRRMNDIGGLVLQGCGGDLQQWVDGINQELTEQGILLDGTTFTNVATFQHRDLTCLLFQYDGAKVAMGKFAIWRLENQPDRGATWLSDYVPNYLGGYLQDKQSAPKPDCELIGQDGNIFNLMGIASRTLRNAGLQDQAEQMRQRIMNGDCQSYDEALNIIGEYVNITGPQEQDDGMEMLM